MFSSPQKHFHEKWKCQPGNSEILGFKACCFNPPLFFSVLIYLIYLDFVCKPCISELLLIQQALNIYLVQVTSTGSVCWAILGRRGRRGGFHKATHQFNLQNYTAAVSAEEIPRNGALAWKWSFIYQFLKRSSTAIFCNKL